MDQWGQVVLGDAADGGVWPLAWRSVQRLPAGARAASSLATMTILNNHSAGRAQTRRTAMNSEPRVAPIQFLAVAFDNLLFDRSIWNAITSLERKNIIHVIDALAVARTIEDEVVAIEVSDLPVGRAGAYGGVIRRLLALEGSGHGDISTRALGSAMLVTSEYEYGITAEELQSVLEDIPRRGGMLALLVEHVWALPLKDAVRNSGGILLAQDFVNPEALAMVAEQLLSPSARR
jgi:hypothetical protein